MTTENRPRQTPSLVGADVADGSPWTANIPGARKGDFACVLYATHNDTPSLPTGLDIMYRADVTTSAEWQGILGQYQDDAPGDWTITHGTYLAGGAFVVRGVDVGWTLRSAVISVLEVPTAIVNGPALAFGIWTDVAADVIPRIPAPLQPVFVTRPVADEPLVAVGMTVVPPGEHRVGGWAVEKAAGGSTGAHLLVLR